MKLIHPDALKQVSGEQAGGEKYSVAKSVSPNFQGLEKATLL